MGEALTPEQAKRNLDEMLDLSGIQGRAKPQYTLPQVLGDYRQVKGFPGWWLRPMKLRQQMRFVEAAAAIDDSSQTARMNQSLLVASCLLYRLDLSDKPEQARAQVMAAASGDASLFRAATEDEILDGFSAEELAEAVLKPLGLWTEDEDPNAVSPT